MREGEDSSVQGWVVKNASGYDAMAGGRQRPEFRPSDDSISMDLLRSGDPATGEDGWDRGLL